MTPTDQTTRALEALRGARFTVKPARDSSTEWCLYDGAKFAGRVNVEELADVTCDLPRVTVRQGGARQALRILRDS